MKKALVIAMMLMLTIPPALAQEIPREVRALCEEAFPGYAALAWDGHDAQDSGQWAIILHKDGDNALCIAEKTADRPYRLTVCNANAVPDEGQAGFGAGMTVSVEFDEDYRMLGRCSRLTMAIAQPGAVEWEITASILEDGETWGDVISEYVFIHSDMREEWFSHVFPESDGRGQPDGFSISYMRHEATLDDRPLWTDSYPRVSVSGASAQAYLMDAFDAGTYPYTPELLDGAQIGDYAQSFVPEGYALRQLDLQQRALILLVENGAGERKLLLYPHQNNLYGPRVVTGTLPAGARLDLAETTEDELCLSWMDEDAEWYMSIRHGENDIWRMSGLYRYDGTAEGELALEFGKNSIAGFGGQWASGRNDSVYYGEHPWQRIEDIDFESLPGSLEEALSQLDQSGWAVVNNPNPADRLHLRERPRKDARSFGKFYNRTPVRVLSVDGEWAHVRIGGMMGYMMTKFLAFGEDMAGVTCAFPELELRDTVERVALRGYESGKTVGWLTRGETRFYVVGTTSGEGDYLILTEDGALGYLSGQYFYPGNG